MFAASSGKERREHRVRAAARKGERNLQLAQSRANIAAGQRGDGRTRRTPRVSYKGML
jgi:hypothetical protein